MPLRLVLNRFAALELVTSCDFAFPPLPLLLERWVSVVNWPSLLLSILLLMFGYLLSLVHLAAYYLRAAKAGCYSLLNPRTSGGFVCGC